MLHGAPIPFIAKLCAAAIVTTGAGVATYEIAVDDGPPEDKVEVVTEDATPLGDDEALAYAEKSSVDDEADTEKEPEKRTVVPTEESKSEATEGHDDEKVPVDEEAAKNDESDIVKDEEETEAELDIDVVAPELVILYPPDGSHHDRKHVVFEGETEPGAVVKAGPYEATVDAEGRWRIELVLSPGANRAVLTAVDAAGNVSDATVRVHLDVEEPKEEKPPKEEEPESVGFSANQQYGSCGEEVPYDVFWGTATPKTVVHIVSAHGSAEVEVDKHGHWEKKVWFETAPRGDAFLVVVEAVNGRSEFEFVATEHEGEHAA